MAVGLIDPDDGAYEQRRLRLDAGRRTTLDGYFPPGMAWMVGGQIFVVRGMGYDATLEAL